MSDTARSVTVTNTAKALTVTNTAATKTIINMTKTIKCLIELDWCNKYSCSSN